MVPAPATAASAGRVPSSAGDAGFEPWVAPAAGRTAESENAAVQTKAINFRFILNCSFSRSGKIEGQNLGRNQSLILRLLGRMRTGMVTRKDQGGDSLAIGNARIWTGGRQAGDTEIRIVTATI